jgi:hypothetical protein
MAEAFTADLACATIDVRIGSWPCKNVCWRRSELAAIAMWTLPRPQVRFSSKRRQEHLSQISPFGPTGDMRLGQELADLGKQLTRAVRLTHVIVLARLTRLLCFPAGSAKATCGFHLVGLSATALECSYIAVASSSTR